MSNNERKKYGEDDDGDEDYKSDDEDERKERVSELERRMDKLIRENTKLKRDRRKAQSSGNRGTKGDIRSDNNWNGEDVNLSDRVTLMCRDVLFPRFKFLKDDWQKYDDSKEASLSIYMQKKMNMTMVDDYEDLWDRVIVPTIRLKYQTIRCNLNNAIEKIYRGEYLLNWEIIYCL